MKIRFVYSVDLLCLLLITCSPVLAQTLNNSAKSSVGISQLSFEAAAAKETPTGLPSIFAVDNAYADKLPENRLSNLNAPTAQSAKEERRSVRAMLSRRVRTQVTENSLPTTQQAIDKEELVKEVLTAKQEAPLMPVKAVSKKENLRRVTSTPKSDPVKDSSSVRLLFRDMEESSKGYALLAPSLKGPLADSENVSLISSARRWTHTGNTSCVEPKSHVSLRGKAAALKEVLFRFSGNDDFYLALNQGVCAKRCEAPTHESLVTGFSVADAKGGDFKIQEEGLSCSYQLSKPETNPWLLLEGDKVVCSCIKKKLK